MLVRAELVCVSSSTPSSHSSRSELEPPENLRTRARSCHSLSSTVFVAELWMPHRDPVFAPAAAPSPKVQRGRPAAICTLKVPFWKLLFWCPSMRKLPLNHQLEPLYLAGLEFDQRWRCARPPPVTSPSA